MADNFKFEQISEPVLRRIGDTLKSLCNTKLTQETSFETKPIEVTEEDTMYTSAFSKLHVSGYIAYSYFYPDSGAKEKNKPCGVAVVYMKDVGAVKFLAALGHENTDYEDKALVKQMVGDVCNNITEGIQNELSNQGYGGLEISRPSSHKDLVEGGVLFPKKIKDLTEISVFMWDAKPVVIDLVLDI